MRTLSPILTILPTHIRFAEGDRADLNALVRHHYRAHPPATFCRVRVARVRDRRSRRWRIIGVAVLSWPVPMLPARNRHFAVTGYGRCLRFANRSVRTVSRVIVHPQFRAAGVAQALVAQLIRRCPTRYVECSTTMGPFAGVLGRSGFTRIPTPAGEPSYFLLDREARLDRQPPPRRDPRPPRHHSPKSGPRRRDAKKMSAMHETTGGRHSVTPVTVRRHA